MASAIGAGPGGGAAPAGGAASVTRPVYPGALVLLVRRSGSGWRRRPHALAAVAVAIPLAVAGGGGPRCRRHVPGGRIQSGVLAWIGGVGCRAPVIAAARVLRLRAGQ